MSIYWYMCYSGKKVDFFLNEKVLENNLGLLKIRWYISRF